MKKKDELLEKKVSTYKRNHKGDSFGDIERSIQKDIRWCIFSKKMTELSILLCSELPKKSILSIIGLKS